VADWIGLSEALERYGHHREINCAASTVTNEKFVLSRFVAWYGDVQLRHLRPEKVQEWFEEQLAQQHKTRDGRVRPPVSASTYNFYRSRLKSFFDYCRACGWLAIDPLRLVPRRRSTTGERDHLTPGEMLALIESATNGRDRAFLATAVNTGLRSGEVRRIRVRDVDLNGGYIQVQITKSRLVDQMPISADLLAFLHEWLSEYARSLGRPLHRDEYLFPARASSSFEWRTEPDGTRTSRPVPGGWRPDRPLTKAERIVQEALRAIGRSTYKEGVHALRRSAARALFDLLASEDQGYDAALRTVSAFLHHKSSATTEHYLGLSSEKRRLDARLRGKSFLSGMVMADADVLLLHEGLPESSG
jgi:integrase